MKYIVLTDGKNEFMFTMPRNALLTHERFSDVVRKYKLGTSQHWERRFMLHIPVSAGFITKDGKTYGESISLDLKSRDEDQELYHDMFLNSFFEKG